jgi:tetratricopeptide (TPR) repeat protein
MPLLAARTGGLRTSDLVLLAALTALALSAGIAPITNNDIWLHLATGRWMLQNRQLPAEEVFSFVAAGRPYVAHEWGSELLFILLHRLAGVAGLVALKAGMAVVLCWAVYAAARVRGAAPAVAALVTGLATFIAGAHIWVRPHLLSWAAALLSLAVLRRARSAPGWLAALIPLQIVWTNVHGGYVLGPVLILGWTAGEGFRRLQGELDARPLLTASAAVAAALACLVNPYGLELLRFPFQLTGSEVFMRAVYEWQSPFTSSYAGTTMFAGFLLLGVLLVVGLVRRPRAIDPCDAAILLGLLVLAAQMNRNVPFFALVAAPVAAALLSAPDGGGGQSGAGRVVPLAVAVLVAAAAGIAAVGYPYAPGQYRPRGVGLGPSVPVAACDYLESRGLRGNAFTTYGEGAFVVWRLWPEVRVSMDSRNSVYGEELYRQYRQALLTDQGLADYLRAWSPDLAIVAHRGPFQRGLDLSTERDRDLPHRGFLQAKRLALVEFDDFGAVYVAETPENQVLLEQEAYRVIHPVLLPAVFPDADLPRAVAEAERAVARHPRAALTRWILANAYAQAGQPTKALEQLEALSRLGPGVATRWGVGRALEVARLGLTGLMEWRAGRCEAARRALERALRLDPDYGPAREILARLDC